jgi:DNA-directed RNA polymerase specialized sigma24 family protein
MAIYRGHIRAFNRGDKAAYHLLYDELSARIYVFAYSFVGQKDWAARVMRDAFSSLFAAHARLSSETAIANFLYIAARNRCLNELREVKMYCDASDEDFRRRVMDAEEVYRLHKKLEGDKLRF